MQRIMVASFSYTWGNVGKHSDVKTYQRTWREDGVTASRGQKKPLSVVSSHLVQSERN